MPTQATISDPDHGHFLGWARAWEILEIGYGSTLEIEIKVEQDTPSIHLSMYLYQFRSSLNIFPRAKDPKDEED